MENCSQGLQRIKEEQEKASGRSLEKGGVVLHPKCNKGICHVFSGEKHSHTETQLAPKEQFSRRRQSKVTLAVEKQASCRPHQIRPSRLPTSVAAAFGADDDGACKSHAISGAHDVKAGLRESRWESWCGVRDLSHEKTDPVCQAKVRWPVRKKESRTCSRFPKDLHCADADRSPHLDAITNQDQLALKVLSSSGREDEAKKAFHEVPLRR